MTPIASRMKDALWSIRRRYGMESDLDRIIPFLVFERELSYDDFRKLFITYPRRTPEEFRAALFARIRETIRHFWTYRRTKKGYHKILKGIYFLENVARIGPDGCQFVHDPNTGYRLELKAARDQIRGKK